MKPHGVLLLEEKPGKVQTNWRCGADRIAKENRSVCFRKGIPAKAKARGSVVPDPKPWKGPDRTVRSFQGGKADQAASDACCSKIQE